MWTNPIARVAGLACFLVLTAIACADTQERIDPMIQDQIQALSMLSGNRYTAARDNFLAEAPALPSYPADIEEKNTHYFVQYMILQGWQQNTNLYREIDQTLAEVDAEFMSISAAGFSPINNKLRLSSEREWKRAGLPYAWETMLKFEDTKPGWLIDAVMMMIQGHPHADSIDPLLLALQVTEEQATHVFARSLLRESPLDGLNARLNSTAPFYVKMRAELQEAVRGR